MSIYTYLMIKTAKDASQMSNEDWQNEVGRLQNLVDNGDAERMRLMRENQELQSQAGSNSKYVKDLEDMYNQDTAKYTALQNHTKDKDPMQYVQELEKSWSQLDAKARNRGETAKRLNDQLSAIQAHTKDKDPLSYITELEDDWTRLDAKSKGRANTIRRQQAEIAGLNDRNSLLSSRGKALATYGGAGVGAGLGGAAGYGLANWGGKKMGLTGNKALALNVLGATAGAGLGGYGGYRLGQYAGDRMFG